MQKNAQNVFPLYNYIQNRILKFILNTEFLRLYSKHIYAVSNNLKQYICMNAKKKRGIGMCVSKNACIGIDTLKTLLNTAFQSLPE